MASNEAHWRAAAKTPVDTKVSENDIEALRLGEIRHHLFQGVGRGAVRKSSEGDVPEGCTLWCIFSTLGPMHIPREQLSATFPSAKIVDWEPFGVQLRNSKLKTDNRALFIEALLQRLGERKSITFELRDLAGDGSAFDLQMVRRYLKEPKDVVKKKLAEHGIVVESTLIKRGRAKFLRYQLRRN
jgi:hypothetical protein